MSYPLRICAAAPFRRRIAGGLCLWLLVGAAADAAAAAIVEDDALAGLVAVDEHRLDRMRGGFELDLGLKLSFGIERVTYINGALVTSQSVSVADLQAATGGQLADALARAGGMGLIQNGAGNSYTLNTNANLVGNVIQNSADNQKIVTRTIINSTVNSLQLLRAMNLQSAVQDGIVGGLRR